jgi:hypothetical protein
VPSQELAYSCKFKGCYQKFNSCFALGGHFSKAHPGMSTNYNRKKIVRERREHERTLHKESMKIYEKKEKDVKILEQVKKNNLSNINRVLIKKIKKDLIMNSKKYS